VKKMQLLSQQLQRASMQHRLQQRRLAHPPVSLQSSRRQAASADRGLGPQVTGLIHQLTVLSRLAAGQSRPTAGRVPQQAALLPDLGQLVQGGQHQQQQQQWRLGRQRQTLSSSSREQAWTAYP
jgi:hypothetical protein